MKIIQGKDFFINCEVIERIQVFQSGVRNPPTWQTIIYTISPRQFFTTIDCPNKEIALKLMMKLQIFLRVPEKTIGTEFDIEAHLKKLQQEPPEISFAPTEKTK